MIEALYRASQAGVLTWLVISDMCSLLPGKAELAENITVKSTVGPVLERARIVRFGAGLGPRRQALVFISSADWMRETSTAAPRRSFRSRTPDRAPAED